MLAVRPRPGPVLALGVTLGVTAAFGQFSVFESAATLGEEARRGTRTIPAAIGSSLAGAAAVYIFFTWVVYAAYPGPAAVAAAPAPLVSIAGACLGGGAAIAVNAAGLISAFGAQLACLKCGRPAGLCPWPRGRRWHRGRRPADPDLAPARLPRRGACRRLDRFPFPSARAPVSFHVAGQAASRGW